MKRDMDLIRELMIKLESYQMNYGSTHCLALNEAPLDYADEKCNLILGHLDLICEANLVEGRPSPMNSNFEFRRITGKGHDFLDSIRDPEIWAKTKAGADAVGGFTVELIGELAKGFIKTKIKQQTGIDI